MTRDQVTKGVSLLILILAAQFGWSVYQNKVEQDEVRAAVDRWSQPETQTFVVVLRKSK